MGGPENTIEAEIAAGGRLAEVLGSFPKVLVAAVHGASVGWGCTRTYLSFFRLTNVIPSLTA
jgi:peroxisomal 3,2-trans-enoyl-CoA isomerase